MLPIMTYNTHHSAGNDICEDPPTPDGSTPQADCSLDLERLAAVVLAENPDIVALQEVDRFWARSGSVDQPQSFAALLHMDVCYGANLTHEADSHAAGLHEHGVATLSRFPIVSCKNIFLPTREGWEQRGMLDTRIAVPGIGAVAVVNTHMQSNATGKIEEASRQRMQQAAAIARHIAGLDIPVVLLGDFNAEANSGDLDCLIGPDSGLADVWSAADGPGETIFDGVSGEPIARIDHILVSRHFTVTSAKVADNEVSRMASDHFPLLADLMFAGDEGHSS